MVITLKNSFSRSIFYHLGTTFLLNQFHFRQTSDLSSTISNYKQVIIPKQITIIVPYLSLMSKPIWWNSKYEFNGWVKVLLHWICRTQNKPYNLKYKIQYQNLILESWRSLWKSFVLLIHRLFIKLNLILKFLAYSLNLSKTISNSSFGSPAMHNIKINTYTLYVTKL